MKKWLALAVVLTIFAAPGAVDAQRWNTPSFLGPVPVGDLGVYVVDGDFGDMGIHGIWRQTGAVNLGIRLGFLDTPDEAIQFGVETWGPVAVADEEFPLDVAWTVGAGATLNGINIVSVPAGLTIGRTFDVGTITMQVYGHPRLVLLAFEQPVTDELELDLDGQFDLGADLYLSETVTFRVAAGLGDADAIGIGIAWRP